MNAVGKMAQIGGFCFLSRVVAATMEVFRSKFPKVVRIETTNHCNARCTFCPRASIGRKKGFMARELYEKIVTECAEGGCSVLHLHNFGEPLLDRRLPELIRFAKEKGINWIKIFTNGALLRDGVARELLKSGLDEIKISMDGASAVEFDRLRLGLDHARVLQNVMAFKEMRDLCGLKHPIITATCVQTSSRKKTRETLRDVADKVAFADLHNWGGEGRLLRKRHVRQPCSRLWQTFTILVTGEVALCCMDHAGKIVLGHCGRQTIADIWKSRSYREVRRLHRNSEQHRMLLCNECSMSFFPPTLSYYTNDV